MGKTSHRTRAGSLAVLGTGSDVGKSLVAAGLCRILHRAGKRVAPFKAQNMSLNSFVTPDGGEMGRAQVLQAQACGLIPHVDMNPILLKPEADQRSQVIVHGKVWRTQDARTYFEGTSPLWTFVRASYERLANAYEVIVIEGAGSAAEVNLRDRDLANWSMVKLADARVVLVADIDRGGVFAQVIGTLDLLSSEERGRVFGVIINKFRGDIRMFDDGTRVLEARTGIPVLGIVPMLRDLVIDQEDSVEVARTNQAPFDSHHVNVAVILLPRMSNFTDFKQLAAEDDVCLRYAAVPRDLIGADVIIIPGSKNTIDDLRAIQRAGFADALWRHAASGHELIGICGGFQMLGREIADPDGVESKGVVDGLRFLDVATRMLPTKVTQLVEAEALHINAATMGSIQGYYIHVGDTKRGMDQPCFRVRPGENTPDSVSPSETDLVDGAVNHDGLIWGTYIHGVFDQPGFRRAWLNRIRGRKGWEAVRLEISEHVTQRLGGELDRWADHLERHLNLKPIFNRLDC